MNLPRRALFINVGFLLNAAPGYSRDIHFEFPQIKFDDDLLFDQFTGLARVSRTPQGILVQCEFSGWAGTECARCLKQFTLQIKTEFSELFAFNDRSTTESDLILRDDANIDLEPLIREYFLIEMPISSLCTPECKGLCSECGVNLNQAACEHVIQ